LPHKSLEALGVDEPCISRWLGELNQRTALNYGYYFLGYRNWLRGKGYWPSAQALLDEYEGLGDSKDRYRHVDVLKEYIRGKGTGTNDRRGVWYAARSFYAFHRMPLPEIQRNEVSRLFEPSVRDKRKAMELAPLRVDEIKTLILNSPQPYKAVLMLMFQGALGLAEFAQFNSQGWRKVVDGLEQPGPLRVDLFREKTSRTSVNRYYTFAGEDGKRILKDWLAMRPESAGTALFVVYNKNTGSWVPVTERLVGNMITKVAKRTGLVKPSDLDRYHVHAHEFRDVFKSLCTLNGVNPIASEFFLGHSIDKLGYDKSPEYDVEWFRREYRKVEPQLNVLSGVGSMEDVKQDATLQAIRRFAEVFGVDPMRVRVEKQKTLGRELSGEEEIQAIQNEIKKMRTREDDPHTIVDEKDLESYLRDGWQFVSVLPSRKILIRK
jgi:hypothetical protein